MIGKLVGSRDRMIYLLAHSLRHACGAFEDVHTYNSVMVNAPSDTVHDDAFFAGSTVERTPSHQLDHIGIGVNSIRPMINDP